MENRMTALDALTGLYRKEAFYRKVRERLDSLPGETHYIVYANIDDFKLVNDLHGRRKGDEVLLKFSWLLRELCAPNGICGRIIADRFAMLIEKRAFSERALEAVAEKMSSFIEKNAHPVSVHFGVYEIGDTSASVSVMAGFAKRALRDIRGNTVRRVAYYNSQFLEQKRREQSIMDVFDSALGSRQFKIFLQPQVSAAGTPKGAEVLVRWVHPERGLVPPGEFIGTLERTGLIARLDRDVWEQAAELLKRWQGTDKDGLYLSVNISAKDFCCLDVYETITEIARKHEIPPRKLRLEITESVLAEDAEKLLFITRRLHERGFLIEIDDFGKGYSSLSMLKDIDANVLKIDMEFLRETGDSEKSRIILESIIAMSRRLGMGVVTEGVETLAQVEFLRSIGCEMFQGYYFAKPMPVADFESMCPPCAH